MATEPGGQPSDSRRDLLDRIAREAPVPPPVREPDDSPERTMPVRSEQDSSSPFWTFISALIFLYVGFGMNMKGISGSALYDGSVNGFTLLAKILGIALLLAGAGAMMRLRLALGIEMIVAALATAGCAIAGIIWVMFNDMQGFLLLIFALVNGSSTRNAFLDWSRK
jgi:hypothetical protein